MRIFITIITLISFISCAKTNLSTSNSNAEIKIPKRDFLILKCDTGVIKMPERFNIEHRNNKINLSTFLENRYLFQVNNLDYEKLNTSQSLSGNEFDMVIVRPPNKPCVCMDKSLNKVSQVKDEKGSAIFIVGKINCDGIVYDVTGAYTGEIPTSTDIITE